MKPTDKMSRAICQLEKMYSVINTEKFESELPTPIITVQSSPRSYGHCTTSKIWYNKDKQQYELNISAEYLNLEIECVLDTLIHEMIHIYCRKNDIKEVSRNGMYHNKKFKDLAEKAGLKCYYDKRIGWNTDHKNNDELLEYAISHSWTEINIGRSAKNIFTGMNPPISNTDNSTENETSGTKTSSTIKYQCPKCKAKIRATKDMDNMIICKPCTEKEKSEVLYEKR